MSFLSPEQIRSVRIKGSKVVNIEGLGKELRVLKMSSGAAAGAGLLQEQVKAGVKPNSALLVHMLAHALSDLDGTLLGVEDAQMLFDLLPMEAVVTLVNEVSALMGTAAAEPPLGK